MAALNFMGHMDSGRLEFNPIVKNERGPFPPDQEACFSDVIKLIIGADKIANDPKLLQSVTHGNVSKGTELSSGLFTFTSSICLTRLTDAPWSLGSGDGDTSVQERQAAATKLRTNSQLLRTIMVRLFFFII